MSTFRLVSRVAPAARMSRLTGRASWAVAPPDGGSSVARRDEAPGEAVEVPWRVVSRSPLGVLEVEHCGSEPLRAVRSALAGAGLLGLTLPRTVHPGERFRIVLRGVYVDGVLAAPDAMLVLRWFQADGRELLWPIAL